MTEDEMIGWHYQFNGHEFEHALGDGEEQRSLACCRWGHSQTWLSDWTATRGRLGFLGGASGKELTCQCGRCKRHKFNSWVGKIPWRRKWQSTSRLGNPLAEEPAGLKSIGLQRVSHHWKNLAHRGGLKEDGRDHSPSSSVKMHIAVGKMKQLTVKKEKKRGKETETQTRLTSVFSLIF